MQMTRTRTGPVQVDDWEQSGGRQAGWGLDSAAWLARDHSNRSDPRTARPVIADLPPCMMPKPRNANASRGEEREGRCLIYKV